MSGLVAAGRPVPRPVWAKAEIDTAANPTAVSGSVLQQLGLTPSRRGATRTAAGSVPVELYRVSVGLPPVLGLASTTVLADDLEVVALDDPPPGIDVLFGFDLLLSCRLTLDGPAMTFTLEF